MVEKKLILDREKLLSAIGLAFKARKTCIGLDLICKSVKYNKTKLIILCANVSDNTKKKICNCASYYNCPIVELDIEKSVLGESVGKSDVACIGIQDENFIKLIRMYIK